MDFSVLILLDCNIHLGNFLKIPISGHNLNPSELESPGKRLGHLPGSQGDSWGQAKMRNTGITFRVPGFALSHQLISYLNLVLSRWKPTTVPTWTISLFPFLPPESLLSNAPSLASAIFFFTFSLHCYIRKDLRNIKNPNPMQRYEDMLVVMAEWHGY